MRAIRTFIDTNILVYAFTSDEPLKKRDALYFLDNCLPVISTQVTREFSNVILKKTNFDSQYVKDVINEITSVAEVVSEEIPLIIEALDLRTRYSYSFYDCLILAAALSSNCKVLLSEDMQNGQIIDDSLLISNPFVA